MFFGAFLQALAQLGCRNEGNVRTDVRWATGSPSIIRKHAAELAALAPDVILSHGGSTVSPMQQATRTIPIGFAVASDPGRDRLRRQSGAARRQHHWVHDRRIQHCREVAGTTQAGRAAGDTGRHTSGPGVPAGLGQFSAIQTAAVSTGIEISALNVRDATEIERAMAAFALTPNSGLIVVASSMAQQQRGPIVSLVAQLKLPAVYFNRTFVSAGGLMSYGVDFVDQYRRAAGYVDRILKGEKPGDLPIQAPLKYQTVVNMKAAKALGITMPQTVLVSADEVIE